MLFGPKAVPQVATVTNLTRSYIASLESSSNNTSMLSIRSLCAKRPSHQSVDRSENVLDSLERPNRMIYCCEETPSTSC